MRASIGLRRSSALVLCLCRLHNFCIDQRQSSKEVPDATVDDKNYADNGTHIILAPVKVAGVTGLSPGELLGHGHHFDDVPTCIKRKSEETEMMVPRDYLHQQMIDMELERPNIRYW